MSNTTTTNVKKVTKAQRCADIISLLLGDVPEHDTTVEEAISYLNKEIEKLSKKRSSSSDGTSKARTKKQSQDDVYRKVIIDFLKNNPAKVMTSADIMINVLMKEFPGVLWSNQKTTALLRPISDKIDKETHEITEMGILEKVIPTNSKAAIAYRYRKQEEKELDIGEDEDIEDINVEAEE